LPIDKLMGEGRRSNNNESAQNNLPTSGSQDNASDTSISRERRQRQ